MLGMLSSTDMGVRSWPTLVLQNCYANRYRFNHSESAVSPAPCTSQIHARALSEHDIKICCLMWLLYLQQTDAKGGNCRGRALEEDSRGNFEAYFHLSRVGQDRARENAAACSRSCMYHIYISECFMVHVHPVEPLLDFRESGLAAARMHLLTKRLPLHCVQPYAGGACAGSI